MQRMRPHPTTLAERPAATLDLPERLNIADRFLDARIREGRGDRTALRSDEGTLSYREVQSLAERWARLLAESGVTCEQRVLTGMADGPDFVGVLTQFLGGMQSILLHNVRHGMAFVSDGVPRKAD